MGHLKQKQTFYKNSRKASVRPITGLIKLVIKNIHSEQEFL